VSSKAAKLTNEDHCDLYRSDRILAVALADGLGSSADSSVAAKLAVKTFLHQVEQVDAELREVSIADLHSFWNRTSQKITNHFQTNFAKYAGLAHPLETTLITVVDQGDSYLISYLGNGSIWYVRGDFWEFLDRRWPWSISDLLISQSVLDDDGRDALYGLIGHTGLHGEIRTLIVNKDHHRGEILIVTTDGISSPDHLKVGHDPNNKLWLEVNPYIERLLRDHLRRYLTSNSPSVTCRNGCLQKVLDDFLTVETFDDDASLGIIVSDSVFTYPNRNHLAAHSK
jgi:hypothetical protein